ncbi:hypothetical protein [Thalassoroseus pseudoceratinae]|uniref:hypothetical protein n=1 Tax=Thalassoroseus pseudoceratinae TaxID=2713176 RepID=UPI0014203B5E|nr:hypothetical protein [Thalassoroseus pseudoceratinae]
MSNAANKRQALWKFFTLFFVFAALTGCRYVEFDQPIGELQSKKKTQRFVGEWRIVPPDDAANDGDRCLTVRMRKNGELRVAQLRWIERRGKFVKISYPVVATRVGEDEFLTWFWDAEDGTARRDFQSVRVKWIDQSTIELYPADFEAFVELQQQKLIAGEIELSDKSNKTIHVKADEIEQYLRKKPEDSKKLFPASDKNSQETQHIRIQRL